MRYRVTFAVGLAVGYVLGSRAGRERYEQIKRTAQRVADSPALQEAAGLVGAQFSKATEAARSKAANALGDRVPFLSRPHPAHQPHPDGTPSEAPIPK
ncbi:hypothetical protein HNP84_002712 [Thermocatellispora tengchongensis]|uniref:YtxH domain-containing protein n=1 Tax=Thermocatellispora tengchongensis TaxID=1073253 RepID=A0A840P545_9ACTN|nr:YtxH domain-containing protein [Thermocatellispora tengchongensis]MBB5132991.1 hypothetical protein [Thermocatellispora tengchongensis]